MFSNAPRKHTFERRNERAVRESRIRPTPRVYCGANRQAHSLADGTPTRCVRDRAKFCNRRARRSSHRLQRQHRKAKEHFPCLETRHCFRQLCSQTRIRVRALPVRQQFELGPSSSHPTLSADKKSGCHVRLHWLPNTRRRGASRHRVRRRKIHVASASSLQ